MDLQRLCNCAPASSGSCPPDCDNGILVAYPRRPCGELIPDDEWAPEQLAALQRARRSAHGTFFTDEMARLAREDAARVAREAAE
jgi:hypothetical protein